ncbi:MAG: AAA family ATPase [Desulfobacterales bacterium]|nr:AAA family ATPase [Desulfobacterales bacterium]
MERNSQIVAMVGPKGGVGKTTISANLSIALAQLGQKVVVVDLDLGASNLHTVFGIRNVPFSLTDFILNKVPHLSQLLLKTDIPHLDIICGGDIPGVANLHYSKKLKLIRNVSAISCDYLVLDLSAGASMNVIDFVMIAQQSLLITTPEVPSLLNAYSFIKSLLFRRLALSFTRQKQDSLLELMERAKDFDAHPELKTMQGIIKETKRIAPEAVVTIEKILSGVQPIIVVNRARAEKDMNAGAVIQHLMNQYLNIQSSLVVKVREDDAVGVACAKLKPALLNAPKSGFAKDIQSIAGMLC